MLRENLFTTRQKESTFHFPFSQNEIWKLDTFWHLDTRKKSENQVKINFFSFLVANFRLTFYTLIS